MENNQELVWVRFQIPKDTHRRIKSSAILDDVNLDEKLRDVLRKGIESEHSARPAKKEKS